MTLEELDRLTPLQKDLDRVEDFGFYKRGYRNWFYGNGAPITGNASKMAKLITDRSKLVRRAKAVIVRWGTQDYSGYSAGQPIRENVWLPFKKALENAGFTRDEIRHIESYR
jgi:hypothetical protein